MKKFWSCCAAIFLIIAACLTGFDYYLVVLANPRVEPAVFRVPVMHGRIMAKTQFKRAGVPVIERGFTEVEKWGNDAVITYTMDVTNVRVDAYRPDPVTAGVFEHAYAEYHPDWQWLLYAIGNVEISNNGLLTISPKPNYTTTLIGAPILIGLCCVFGYKAQRRANE